MEKNIYIKDTKITKKEQFNTEREVSVLGKGIPGVNDFIVL